MKISFYKSKFNSKSLIHPYNIVDEFEQVVAEYIGAQYGIAVDSCTNALFLSLVLHRLKHGVVTVELPCKTYVGVAHAVKNAGHICKFTDYNWEGSYVLTGTNIIDSARSFTRNIYAERTISCLSFHWYKHLPIGRGGMILIDNEDDYKLLRRMRYDGRTERIEPKDDVFDVPGYHCVMHPDDAARGLMLMQNMPNYIEDLPTDNYADLSKHKYFIDKRC